VPSSVLDRFCQNVAQIVQTQGACCFALGAADNRLHPQSIVDLEGTDAATLVGHVDIDAGTPFSSAVVRALNGQEPVVIEEEISIAGMPVRPPVMVMPIIWEREPLDEREETVRRPVGVLALWNKRAAKQFDEDDYKLAETLSSQAAALLVEEQLEEFDDIQAAFATVPVGLMLVDANDGIVVANAAGMRVLQVDPLQGRKVQDVDYRGQLAKLLSDLRENHHGQANASFASLDGENYAASAQLTQEDQAIIAFTQSPFTTAAEELVGQVAHELRTPLTVIQGNLQTVEAMLDMDLTGEDFEIIDEFTATALIQSARMFRLINETLNISRIHAGKELELDAERFDLVDALEQIMAELADRLAGHNVVREAPEALVIDGDRGKIISIFDNYLKNAAKYADPGTTITVRIKDLGDEVAIEVQDEGIGIPADEVGRIGKEPGFRTEISRSQAGGIGLGMVYTRRVTEAHGGRMEIESEVGKGSTFRSVLPKTQPRQEV
jgi:signal transduction histidine kinase